MLSEEHRYFSKEGQRDAMIRGLAHKLAGIDPLISPTRYARLLDQLNTAKADQARQKQAVSDDNRT